MLPTHTLLSGSVKVKLGQHDKISLKHCLLRGTNVDILCPRAGRGCVCARERNCSNCVCTSCSSNLKLSSACLCLHSHKTNPSLIHICLQSGHMQHYKYIATYLAASVWQDARLSTIRTWLPQAGRTQEFFWTRRCHDEVELTMFSIDYSSPLCFKLV